MQSRAGSRCEAEESFFAPKYNLPRNPAPHPFRAIFRQEGAIGRNHHPCCPGRTLTVDEEISKLDDNLRRLKIEYDVYFGGGSKKPPTETEWRVTNSLKRIGETMKLSYAQRFRFNAIAQRYAVFSDLWRQKMKVKEEGFRRPADAMLGITGMRRSEELDAAEAIGEGPRPHTDLRPFKISCSDPNAEHAKVQQLYHAMLQARRRTGDESLPNFESFQNFVRNKTAEIRRQYGCHSVEYTIEVREQRVKLKAKAKV